MAEMLSVRNRVTFPRGKAIFLGREWDGAHDTKHQQNW